MRLVKFENGKFGVRTYWFFGWHFMDLASPGFHWKRKSDFFPCCMGSRELAESCMAMQSPNYEVIK